jgi:large subunit ribosomal protein L17
MRHRVKGHKFNRDTENRKALLRNLVRNLVEHGEIETTQARAKEVKRLTDRLVSKAKKGDLTARRTLHRFFGKRDIVNTLVDKIAPVMKDRVSGFTRVVKAGIRRGDNVELYKIEFVEEAAKKAGLKNEARKTVKKVSKAKTGKTKLAKKIVKEVKPSSKKETSSKKAAKK